MATVIKIKNSGTSGAPSAVGTGELAYSYLAGTESNGGDRVYVGTGTETAGVAANIDVIGGKYFTDKLDHTLGVRTANSAALLDASGKIDVWDVDNLKLDGNTISSTNTNGNIIITPSGAGNLILDGHSFPQADGSASQYLQTNGAGQLAWSTVVSTITLTADSGVNDVVNTGESIAFVGGNLIDTAVTNNSLLFSVNDSQLYTKFGATDTTGHGGFSYNSTTGVFDHVRVTVADVRGDVSSTDTAGHGAFSYNSTTGVFAHTRVTPAEVRGDISVTDNGGDGALSYAAGTGVITYTGPNSTEVRAHFSGGTGVAINNGVVSIGQPVGTSDNVQFGNATLSGNLIVNGTTTTINSTVVTIDDPVFTLGGDTDPASDDNKDRGIEFRYHDGVAPKLGFMGWDDSASSFTLMKNATNTSETFSGTAADLTAGTVTGTEFIGLVDGGTY